MVVDGFLLPQLPLRMRQVRDESRTLLGESGDFLLSGGEHLIRLFQFGRQVSDLAFLLPDGGVLGCDLVIGAGKILFESGATLFISLTFFGTLCCGSFLVMLELGARQG
ncbi:hypothetical protein EGT07_26910 [Herbaspirillum sp. HC18]|nr:hypothetical protein EGT07_26910 [Herbaspirillum sp. HC18]